MSPPSHPRAICGVRVEHATHVLGVERGWMRKVEVCVCWWWCVCVGEGGRGGAGMGSRTTSVLHVGSLGTSFTWSTAAQKDGGGGEERAAHGGYVSGGRVGGSGGGEAPTRVRPPSFLANIVHHRRFSCHVFYDTFL